MVREGVGMGCGWDGICMEYEDGIWSVMSTDIVVEGKDL